MSTLVSDVLRDAGLGEREKVIAAAIEAGLARVDAALRVAPGAGLGLESRQVLAEAGLDFAEADPDELTRIRSTAAEEYAKLTAGSFTVAKTAELLGVDESRVRQRLGNRSLHGFKAGRAWQVPSWQFEQAVEIPSLSDVVHASSEDNSIALGLFMTRPNLDLDAGDGPMSPRDWLVSGRSAQRVVDLVSSLTTS